MENDLRLRLEDLEKKLATIESLVRDILRMMGQGGLR